MDVSLYPALAQISQDLKETNRLLAIIAGVPYRPKAAATTPSKVELITSNSLDGTVHRAGLWPDGSMHEIPQPE